MLYAKVDETAKIELKQALKKADRTSWYRRLKSIEMSGQGQSVHEIANFFELSYNTIRSYIKQYNEAGLGGLKPTYGPGRKAEISLSKEQLLAVLERSPSQFEKLQTGARNWTQTLLKEYLWHYHQINISQGAISVSFKRMGLAWNRVKKSDLTRPAVHGETATG